MLANPQLTTHNLQPKLTTYKIKMSQLLSQKLSALRRKRATVTTLVAGTGAVGAVVLLIGLTLVLDWWLELPRVARAGMLAVELAILVYTVVWRIIRPILYGPDDEELALAVERESPGFRSRLISVIQLARSETAGASGMSMTMVGALVRETEQLAEPVDFTRVVKIDRLATLGTIVGLIVVGFGLAVMMTAPASVALIQRVALMNVPVPRKTIVECLSKDMVTPRGESVTIVAKASGLIIPAGGTVKVTSPAGVVQTYELPRDEGSSDHYSRAIDNIQDNFTYTVYLNDGHSEEFNVTASIRPAVASIDCQQKFPDYTSAGTIKRQTGDLSILQGSRLLMNILANKPVKVTATTDKVRNHIHLHGSEVDFPLSVTSGDGTKLVIQDAGEPGIPLPAGTTGFSVHLVAPDGLTSKNPAIYPITLVPDAPPRIAINSPKRNDELVTPQATVDVGFDASDDFGVKEMYLRYRLIDAEGNTSNAAGDGLKGEYFSIGHRSQTRLFDRIDPSISFDWSSRNGVGPSTTKHDIIVRWSGQLQPAVSGDYTFTMDSAAKCQITLDGKPLLENNVSKPIALTAFQRYDLNVEYLIEGTLVPVQMMWEAKGLPKSLVPKECLFSTAVADKTSLVATGGVPEKVILLPISTGKSVRGYYPWKISDFAATLPLGTVIQWRLEARDNNNVTGPGITFSEPMRQVRLVSPTDKRKELMDQMTDTLTQIDSIKDAQSQNQQRTAGLVTGTSTTAPTDLPDSPTQK